MIKALVSSRKACVIGLVLAICSQLTGINAVIYCPYPSPSSSLVSVIPPSGRSLHLT